MVRGVTKTAIKNANLLNKDTFDSFDCQISYKFT